MTNVIASSKKGTVEKMTGGFRPFGARTRGGELIGTYNNVDNAKRALEAHGTQNVGSGYVGPVLIWK